MNKLEQKFLLYLFFFALILRLGFLVFLKNNYLFYGHPSDDVAYYQDWAKAIVFGETPAGSAFPGMPLFPYYLAVLFRICAGHWIAVNIFNLFLGSLNCVLLYLVTKKIFSNPTAVVAAILASINFTLIYYDWLMMPVTLLITLTLSILLALSDEGPTNFKEWAILGIFIGAATLGDAKFLIFAALLTFYFAWRNRKGSVIQIARSLFPLFLGLTIILGGVTLRNKIVSGDWVFITSQSGLSLYVGNNPTANGAFENPEFIRPSHKGQDEDQRIFVEKALGRKVSPSEVSHFYKKQALDFITQHPGDYLILLGKKISLLLSDNEASHDIDLILQRNIKIRLDWNPYVLIFPTAVFGLFLAIRSKKKGEYAFFLILSYVLYSCIYFVTTRQRAPILPLLIMFEAFAFVWIADTIQARSFKKLIVPTLLFLSFALLFPPRYLNNEAYAFLVHSKSGSVYDTRKDYPKAERSYLAALNLAPTDSNTLFNLGTAYLHQNEFDKAKQYFLKSIASGKFNVDALFDLGYVYEQTGESDKALKAYQEVLYSSPESLDAAYRIAMLYQSQGKCNQAQPYFAKITQAKPALSVEIQKISQSCKNRE